MNLLKGKLTQLSFYIWCFMACSFLGWVYESVWKSILVGGFVNSGFLHGFYLPIYGFGGLLLIFCLKKCMEKKSANFVLNYIVKPVLMFLLITILVSALEYVASYIMEVMFHQRWWDYSNLPYNINGRVALSNSLILGSLGFVFVYFVHPLMKFLCGKVNLKILHIVAFLIVLMIVTDTVITILEMCKLI